MSEKKLSSETMRAIDELVKRVARKSGYRDTNSSSYKEHLQSHLQNHFERGSHKFNQKMERFQKHFDDGRPSGMDFAEEIKSYICDGIIDLMSEGHSEEEALKMTMEKFDEAESANNFEGFSRVFNDFGLRDQAFMAKWYAKNGEKIGLFYAAFLILGVSIGGLVGFVAGKTLLNTIVGLVAGAGIGIGAGLLSHAKIVARRGLFRGMKRW